LQVLRRLFGDVVDKENVLPRTQIGKAHMEVQGASLYPRGGTKASKTGWLLLMFFQDASRMGHAENGSKFLL
jgi:hypothetical protein